MEYGVPQRRILGSPARNGQKEIYAVSVGTAIAALRSVRRQHKAGPRCLAPRRRRLLCYRLREDDVNMSVSNRNSADLDTAGLRHATDMPHDDRVGRLEDAISNPGSVKINVKGAFILDEDSSSKSPIESEGVHYENKDIRLPHHTGLVSHVAVDVSFPSLCSPHNGFSPQSARSPM